MVLQCTHPRLPEILVCPACRGKLRNSEDLLACAQCRASFAIQKGVPIFLSTSVIERADHLSNPMGGDFEAILREGKEFVLHIGAGGTAARYKNCIELEHQIFCHTDVVGDAHQLPFCDNAFDRVFAFNVFEHLAEPKRAAGEILRVLKPGGSVAIHTAFLQAVHEEPNHFFNATESGVREWFSAFAVDECRVSGNFGPGVMLAFLAWNVIEAARQGGASWKDVAQLSNTAIGEWADFWADRTAPPDGFGTLQGLPQSIQKAGCCRF